MVNPFNFLNYSVLGNTLESYLWFVGILAIGLTIKKWISCQLTRLLFSVFKRHSPDVGVKEFVALLNKPFQGLFTVLIIYLAFDKLSFPTYWNIVPKDQTGLRLILFRIFDASIVIACFWIILRFIDFVALIFLARARKTVSKTDDQLVPFVKEAVKVILVVVGFFVVLGVVFHLDVVSLVAGLGIGGLAIALAAKETLENLLGSFTIFLDKPFVAGDSVRVGNIEGKVERVGFRSTRILAIDKMMVTVPNKRMIDAELINETDRIVRRASFTLSLSYDTSEEQIRKILNDIRRLLNEHKMLEHGNEIVRFRNFGPTGLEVLVIFFVMTTDMNEFLGVQEEVNFEIMAIVKKNHSSFAVLPVGKSDPVSDPVSYKTLVAGKEQSV